MQENMTTFHCTLFFMFGSVIYEKTYHYIIFAQPSQYTTTCLNKSTP